MTGKKPHEVNDMNSERSLVNYHTHTWRCQHAEGTEEDFVRAALENGFSVLGFADHTPWPYTSDFVSNMRMRWDQFPGYMQSVRGLAEAYRGRIRILAGLECEAFPGYMGWLADLKAEQLDFVILGNHYDATDEGDHRNMTDAGGFYFGRCTRPEHISRYVKRTVDGMRTGLFDYVAHPDLFCHTYPHFDEECAAASRDLCAAAADLDLPLEYNLLGVQKAMSEARTDQLGYPCAGFWEIAALHGVKAIVGFDAHRPDQLGRVDLYDRAVEYLGGLGIEVLPSLPQLN